MTKTQKIFEAVVVIIGMILLAGWLYVMISMSSTPLDSGCITPSGDSYYCGE